MQGSWAGRRPAVPLQHLSELGEDEFACGATRYGGFGEKLLKEERFHFFNIVLC